MQLSPHRAYARCSRAGPPPAHLFDVTQKMPHRLEARNTMSWKEAAPSKEPQREEKADMKICGAGGQGGGLG